MKKVIGAFILGVVATFLGAFLFVKSGLMPVATAGDPLPFERKLAHTAIRAAMGAERDAQAPFPVSDEALVAGAKIYAADCAVCHGLPGQAPTNIAAGMFPKPPQLFDGREMVTDDPVGSIFWKARNGIRLTGMPGFVGRRSDQELWQVSLTLKTADKLPPGALAALK